MRKSKSYSTIAISVRDKDIPRFFVLQRLIIYYLVQNQWKDKKMNAGQQYYHEEQPGKITIYPRKTILIQGKNANELFATFFLSEEIESLVTRLCHKKYLLASSNNQKVNNYLSQIYQYFFDNNHLLQFFNKHQKKENYITNLYEDQSLYQEMSFIRIAKSIRWWINNLADGRHDGDFTWSEAGVMIIGGLRVIQSFYQELIIKKT